MLSGGFQRASSRGGEVAQTQFLHGNEGIAAGEPSGLLMQEGVAGVGHALVQPGEVTTAFASALRAPLAAAEGTLGLTQPALGALGRAWVWNDLSIGKHGEVVHADVQPHRRTLMRKDGLRHLQHEGDAPTLGITA